MKFPLTERLIDEARRFELRSACRDCFYWRPASAGAVAGAGIEAGSCAHDWPDEGQRRWPIDAPNAGGTVPTEVAFCKEFELA